MIDIIIRNGEVVDPSRNHQAAEEVWISRGKIVDSRREESQDGETVIDATDCLVLPGLIDFHAHVFPGGTEMGVPADATFLPQGITTVVDGGSAGSANYEAFFHQVIMRNQVRILSLLNVSTAGLATTRYPENVDPKYFNRPGIEDLFHRFGNYILGLKLRQSTEIVGELGIQPVQRVLEIADSIGCRIVVHMTNPPCSPDEIARLLRKDDVFCHVFYGTGQTIVDRGGKILEGVIAAREKGVIFDAANGKNHFSFQTAKVGFENDFLPDVISSDLTAMTLFGNHVFSLPFVLSKYLSMGMPLRQTIAACTSTPALWMGLSGKIGTLAPGAEADVSIFRLVNRSSRFIDSGGTEFVGRQLLVPQVTILGGKIVHAHLDFSQNITRR
jgi:dihydroorotase